MMLLSNNRLRSLVFAMLIMFVIFTKFVNLKLDFTIEHSLVIIIIFWSVDNEHQTFVVFRKHFNINTRSN